MDISVHFDTNKESKPNTIYFRHLCKIQMNMRREESQLDATERFIACCPAPDRQPPATKALHTHAAITQV
jgi:hypothetical protein